MATADNQGDNNSTKTQGQHTTMGDGRTDLNMAAATCLNLAQLRSEFAACVKEDPEDVLLSHYVSAYMELLQIVKSLGKVFYFVVQDVQDKINILSAYLSKEAENYQSLTTMIDFERENNRFTPQHPSNGCRTYLRLHRALLFIFRFIEELVNTEDKEQEAGQPSLGQLTQKVYKETLADYHAWIVRKAVTIAVLALPSRNDFLATLCRQSGMNDRDSLLTFLRESLAVMQNAYTVSQNIYAANSILDLE